MLKKLFSILLSVMVTTAFLTGCGNSENSTQKETTAPQNTEQNVENNTQQKSENITLTVFDAQAYGLERYNELIKGFEASHPGVKIEVQHAPNDFDALLKSKFNSNEIPDIFAIQTGTAAQSYYEFAYDWSEDKDVLNLFQDDALATGTDTDGLIKSLPWTYENMGLIYNKDLFKKAGITELPTTMDELEAACKKLDSVGITPFAIAAKELWVLSQISTHYMMDKSIDAKAIAEKINNQESTFKELKNYKNLFKFLDLAVEYGPDKPLEVDWETSENMLANGEAAIIHMGDWCQATLDEFNPNANLAFLPCPVSDNPDDVTLLSSVSWTYIVNKDSKNLDLAKEYLTYILTSKEGIDWMCNTICSVPAAKGEHKVAGALANDAASYIAQGKTNGWIHTLFPQGFQDNIGSALQSCMLKQSSVDDTISSIQEAWFY